MAKYNKNPFRLFKRGEIWHAYFSVVAGGRRIVVRETTGCKNEDDAKAWCAERINRILTAPVITHETTLDAAAEKWWSEHGQFLVKPEGVFNRIKNLLMGIDPKILLSQISKADIAQFISYSQSIGRSPATINRYLCLLSAICNRAHEFWDCHVPEYRILSFKLKEPKENIKYFKDWDEIQAVIDNAAPHLKPVILTAIYTGMRMGRILSLKWEQIDWTNNIIAYMGKDGRPHAIPMVQQLRDTLSQIPRKSEYVFTYNGRQLTRINQSWKKAFERAGVPYRNFHTLRHTTATWMLKTTGNLRLVQNVLDHHNISTTTKYAHLIDTETQTALQSVFKK